jgi:predicted DNA-binding transcriptional regulator AlpA
VSRKLELMGLAEVCEYLGLERTQVRRLEARGAFPAPVAVLRATPVWRAADIRAFKRRALTATDGAVRKGRER